MQDLVNVTNILLVSDLWERVDPEVAELLRRAVVQLYLGQSRHPRDKHQSQQGT